MSDPKALIPGLHKAIEFARQYQEYDLGNAEKLPDDEDKDRALNCSMRFGQFICVLKQAIRHLEQDRPMPDAPVEVNFFDLPGVIKFAKRFAPLNMQQDEQDFEDWVKSAWGTGYYFSWPRGERATATIHMDMQKKEIKFSTSLLEEEAEPYRMFADDLRFYLGW